MRTLAGLASFVVLAALFAFALSRTASATGPWVQTDNGYYTTARFGFFSSSNRYDPDGNEVDLGDALKYKEKSLRFDAEYGLSNKMTLLLGMPVLWKTYDLPEDVRFNNSGFGDIDFGLKYGILANPESKGAAAVQLSATAPSGYNAEGIGVPSMGRGRFSILGALHAGLTLDPAPVYFQGRIGYRHFTKEAVILPDTSKTKMVSDALVYGLEAGFHVTPKILIVGEYTGENASDTDKHNFQSFSQIGGNVHYRLKPSLEVMAGAKANVSGKNSINESAPVWKGTQIFVGVGLKGNDLGRNRGQGAYGYDEKAFPNAKPRKPPTPVPVPDPVPAPVVPTPAPSDTTGTPK